MRSLAKQKKKKKSNQLPGRLPAPAARPFNVSPNLFEIQHIKQQATDEAVRILEEKLHKSDAELRRLQIEAYNEAINDAEEYIIVMACRALFNVYGFAYKRQDRFLSELMRLLGEEDLEPNRKWLKDLGFELVLTDVGDEIKRGEERHEYS